MSKDQKLVSFRGPGFTPSEIPGLSLEQAAAWLESVEKAPAIMTPERVSSFQQMMAADFDLETRQIALELLCQSGRALIEKVAEDDEVAMSCARLLIRLSHYRVRLNALRDLMETAATRGSVAIGLRSDGEQLLSAAEEEPFRTEDAE